MLFPKRESCVSDGGVIFRRPVCMLPTYFYLRAHVIIIIIIFLMIILE
jgi:hypothetical protein